MNGNSSIEMKRGVHVADLPTYKKPKMQKVIIRVEVEDEKGEKVSGFKNDEWLASVSIHEVLEKAFEAIGKIE